MQQSNLTAAEKQAAEQSLAKVQEELSRNKDYAIQVVDLAKRSIDKKRTDYQVLEAECLRLKVEKSA